MENREEFIQEYEACQKEWAGMLIKTELPELSKAINSRLDEISLMRKLFTVKEMPKGESPAYPVPDEFFTPVWILPGMGYMAQDYMEVMAEEAVLSMFSLQVAKDWKLSYMEEGRVDIIVKALESTAKILETYEREAGWRTIFPVITSGFDGAGILQPRPAPIYEMPANDPAAGYFSKELINRMIVGAKRQGLTLVEILASPEDLADIREWTDLDVAPETRAKIFQASGLGQIWGIKLTELDDLGVRGSYNICDRTSQYGPFRGNTKDNSFNDYHIIHGNVTDENGNLVIAGQTQIIGLCEGHQDQLRLPYRPYQAHYDWSLMRRQKAGFFGWMEMGMGCLDARYMLMGVIDRYVPGTEINVPRSMKPTREIDKAFISKMLELLRW